MTSRRWKRRFTRLDDFGPDARNRLGRPPVVRRLRIAPYLLGALLLAGVGGSILAEGRWNDPISSPVRAQFGLCHHGGGRNCVVDGDTFWIGGRKVRIVGIDAPETHPSRCPNEARKGQEAIRLLQQTLNSGPVQMRRGDRDKDRNGRLLRHVTVSGKDVGDRLVAAGVAHRYGGRKRDWCV